MNAFGSADTVTVNDLAATDVTSVDIDLGVGGIGDLVGGRGDRERHCHCQRGEGVRRLRRCVRGEPIARRRDRGLGARQRFLDRQRIHGRRPDQRVHPGDTSVRLTINGNTGDDILVGSQGGDTINGGSGNDHISAGDGNDTIDGGADTDTIDGGAGIDVAINGENVTNVP